MNVMDVQEQNEILTLILGKVFELVGINLKQYGNIIAILAVFLHMRRDFNESNDEYP